MEKKSFGIALLMWFIAGGIGGHRIYIQEKASVLLWYWIVTIITVGIFPIVDLFLIGGMIERRNLDDKIRSLE